MTIPVQAAARDAFVRFRDEHDVEALAFVFDHTAQGLLLVACHLAVPGVDAEDLVQSTFVQAMRNAHAYDAARPLEPWLLGILGNEAHGARRRAQRAVDGTLLPRAPIDDPVLHAEQREQVQRLQQAIDSLSERQREVMALYWVHGMSPTEIAHALGRSVGTVKSWVHRGLVQLRRRVPAAMALAPAAVPPQAARLVTVREAILVAAREFVAPLVAAGRTVAVATAAAAPGAVHGGWRFTRRALTAAMAAAGSFAVWHAAAGQEPVPPGAATASPAAAAPPAAGDPGAAALAPELDAARAAATPATSCELLVVARWHDGSPAALGGDVEPRHGSDPRLRRLSFATDAAGHARVPGLPPGAVHVRLDRGGELALVLQPGANVAELGVARGVTVRGRVLDDRGDACPGAQLWLARDERRDDGVFVASAGAGGAFVIRDVPPGAAIAAFADGFVPARAVTVRGDHEHEPLVVQFEQTAGEAAIAVVGPDGAALAGAWVQVGGTPVDAPSSDDACRAPPPWLGRTDDAGQVCCRQVPHGQRVPVFARAADHAGACQWLRLGGQPAAVALRLPPSAGVTGTVTTDGEPVAAAEVRVVTDVPPSSPARLPPRWFLAQVRASADGAWELTGVALGSVALEARDGGLFAATECQVAAPPVAPWHAQLSRGGRVAGVARCADGTPLPGYRVELHAHGVAHAAATGADGSFAIGHLGAWELEAILREPAELGETMVSRRRGVRAGDALDLVVPAARVGTASVRCRLLDADGAPLPGALLHRSDRPDWHRELACATDGAFVADRLPAGDYVLLAGAYPYALVRSFTMQAGGLHDLGTLRGAGLTRCLATIADDRPRSGLEVVLALGQGAPLVVAVARWLGAHDTVELPAPAGDYLLTLFDGHVLVHQQRVALTAAANARVLIPAPPATRWHVGLRLPATSAWTRLNWRLTGADLERIGSTGPRPPGEQRPARLAFALPPGRYRFTVVADSGERADADVHVDADRPSEPALVEPR